MTTVHLKQADGVLPDEERSVRETVARMLAEIEQGGDAAAAGHARTLDGWRGDIVVPADAIARAAEQVPEQLRRDIAYAHDNIRRFAEAQLATCTEMQIELRDGLVAGQRQIPVETAGCYVPGGRYCHIASALMTVTTARTAGVKWITACSPPRGEAGIPPEILYTLDLCGADRILTIGGVQGIGAMAFGLFGAPAADILVGPGNQYVAEAKRVLFGRVGIDMIAGPTDSLVLADETADPTLVAWDLVGQAEHGDTSPVWLVTDCRGIAEAVMERIPGCIAELPRPNRDQAERAWERLGEVVLCDDREEMARWADRRAPEHLHVQAADLGWWLERLRCYGSLFLGERATVAFGDKASGPNHVLPTSGAARYTGGLSVHTFLKTVTWQRVERQGLRDLAQVSARISRYEGMEGHARTADLRLRRCFPHETFSLSIDRKK